MFKPSIYLIEDNLKYRLDLKKEIEKYFHKNSITEYNIVPLTNYNDFYENMESKDIRPNDIFIVDIDLRTYFSGIKFGEKIRQCSIECKIIYLTSLMDKAIETINQNIFPNAYLVKSNDMEITQLELSEIFGSLMSEHNHDKNTFVVNTHNVKFVLTYSEVLYISIHKAYRNKLKVETINSYLIIDGPLSKYKKELPSTHFFLDFKSIIINYQNIKSLAAQDRLVTFMNDSSLSLTSKLIYKLIQFKTGGKST